MAERLRQLPRGPFDDWEGAAVTGLGTTSEGPRVRPQVLLALLVVERDTDFVLIADAIAAPRLEAEFGRRFVAQVLALGLRPRRILVNQIGLRELVAPIAKAMDGKLLGVQYLPGVDRASEDIHVHFGPANRGQSVRGGRLIHAEIKRAAPSSRPPRAPRPSAP